MLVTLGNCWTCRQNPGAPALLVLRSDLVRRAFKDPILFSRLQGSTKTRSDLKKKRVLEPQGKKNLRG